MKRESMGRRFKGELRDLVERIDSTEVRWCFGAVVVGGDVGAGGVLTYMIPPQE